jgi:hypothetical protein
MILGRSLGTGHLPFQGEHVLTQQGILHDQLCSALHQIGCRSNDQTLGRWYRLYAEIHGGDLSGPPTVLGRRRLNLCVSVHMV